MHYFPHYIGDYAKDAGHLSWDEDMAYMRLLRVYYATEKPIPADIVEACRKARCTTATQRAAVGTVLREFFELRSDGWHQKRCDEEIAHYNAVCEKARKNGKKGGRPKMFPEANVPRETLPKANLEETKTVSDRLAKSNPTLTGIKANQNHNHNQEPEDTPPTPRKRGEGFDPLSIALPDWLDPAVWALWVQHRRERKPKLTETSCEIQLRHLGDWRTKGQDPKEIIERAIRNGWQGLFEAEINGHQGNGIDKASMAWTKVRAAIKDVGPYRAASWDDPVIPVVIADMGGWMSFCEMKTSDAQFRGREFEAKYRHHATRAVA